jgi:hypothetical protein
MDGTLQLPAEAPRCDFCDRPLGHDRNPAYVINICNDCAKLVLRAVAPEIASGNDNERNEALESMHSSLDRHVNDFIRGTTRFEAAPDATLDEKLCAAREVLRSLIGINAAIAEASTAAPAAAHNPKARDETAIGRG